MQNPEKSSEKKQTWVDDSSLFDLLANCTYSEDSDMMITKFNDIVTSIENTNYNPDSKHRAFATIRDILSDLVGSTIYTYKACEFIHNYCVFLLGKSISISPIIHRIDPHQLCIPDPGSAIVHPLIPVDYFPQCPAEFVSLVKQCSWRQFHSEPPSVPEASSSEECIDYLTLIMREYDIHSLGNYLPLFIESMDHIRSKSISASTYLCCDILLAESNAASFPWNNPTFIVSVIDLFGKVASQPMNANIYRYLNWVLQSPLYNEPDLEYEHNLFTLFEHTAMSIESQCFWIEKWRNVPPLLLQQVTTNILSLWDDLSFLVRSSVLECFAHVYCPLTCEDIADELSYLARQYTGPEVTLIASYFSEVLEPELLFRYFCDDSEVSNLVQIMVQR